MRECKYQKWLWSIPVVSTLLFFSSNANACISSNIENNNTASPTIVVSNSCSKSVTWKMCINVSGRFARDYPIGVTAPGGRSRYGLWLNPGETFRMRVSYAEGAYNYDAVRQPNC